MTNTPGHGIPHLLTCPQCGTCDLDLRAFNSLMVLSHDAALFSLTCPHCNIRMSTIQPIPPSLRDEVNVAAATVHAGMGRQ